MNTLGYKKIIRVITITLTLIVSVFVATGVSAQALNVPTFGSNPDISVTAVVPGCGNGIVEVNLGEQCEGGQPNVLLDLNGRSCIDLGFSGGVLGCRASCIYETSLCRGPEPSSAGRGGGSRGGSRRRVSGVQSIPDTNIIFTGQGEPGSNFFVLANGEYLGSTIVHTDGSFSLTHSDPEMDEYDFTFYTVSPSGLFGPHYFSTDIRKGMTTYINNIFIPFFLGEVQEQDLLVEPDTLLGLDRGPIALEEKVVVSEIGLINSGVLSVDIIDHLRKDENLSPLDVGRLIDDVDSQNLSSGEILSRERNFWSRSQAWLTDKTGGLNKWYPNVYVSFMIPYWDVPYDWTRWFDKYRDPLGAHYSLRSFFY